MKNLILGKIAAALLVVSQAWAANIPIKISEPGSVKIPFTANITADTMKTELKGLFGPAAEIDENLLEERVGKAIRERIEALKKEAPDVWGVDEAEIIKSIEDAVNKALAQIKEKIKEYNGMVDAACGKAATNAKAALDNASPFVRISSNYVYTKDEKDPGDPGWGGPSLSYGTEKIQGDGSIQLTVTVVLDPEVLGNKIGGIEFEIVGLANIMVALEPHAIAPNISPLNQSSAEASAVPKLRMNLSGSGKAGGIIYISVGAAITRNIDLGPRIKGTIVAGVEE